MVKPRTVDIRFPGLGVVRRQGHERQYSAVNYPTPWAINTRLEDPLTNRLRGGSFTGRAAESRPSTIVYRDRTLTFSDNAITASRVGDSTDTTLSADVSDMLRPSLFQFAEADQVGNDVVALVPHKDKALIGFTATETWVLHGDPLSGTIRRVSDEVGIIGADAWCVAHDTVYFLSSRGLYSVSADGSGLKAISEDVIPEDLIGLSDTAASLDYYHADRGVYIHLTDSPSWFFDTERGGFWPFDTGTSSSHILLGPLRLGGPDSYGMIQRMHGIIAADSADVTWRIVTGDTAEEACVNGKAAITAFLAGGAYSRYVDTQGTWSAGRSPTTWPRARGMWSCVWLYSTGVWAYESVHLMIAQSGRWRG